MYYKYIFAYIIIRNRDYFLLFTVSLAEVSTCPALFVARHVNTPESSSYVDVINRTAMLPSYIICNHA